MGHVEVVKSLLIKEPSIGSMTDKKGQTAFHMAVEGNNVEMVQELLKPDTSIINLGDSKGNTALHIATRKGNLGIVQALLTVEGVNINAINKVGQTPLNIAEKCENEEITAILRAAGSLTAMEQVNPPKQFSYIKHGVQSQLRQTRQTEERVQNIKKRLLKLHLGGLNNAINSNIIVAVLIATVAFAAVFTVPGQYIESSLGGTTLGQAYYIADNAAFIIFLVSNSLALFISVAVVVVQTSLMIAEEKALE